MLGLFSNKTHHPLAEAREVKLILATIANRDPLSAVEDAGAWLESLVADGGFTLAQRLELIFKFDETALPQARRLARDYPALSDGNRVLETKTWELAHAYWRQLAAAYLDCIARHNRAERKEADSIHAQQPLLQGRLLHALACQLKWMQFRYGPVDPAFWMTLGGVYLAAVEAKTARKPFQLYATGAETTIEAEYLKTLVFHATSMDTLQPLGIEVTEHLINFFLPFFSLTREILRESAFWADAAQALPPTRLAKRPALTTTLRFFDGTRAAKAIGETIEQIRREARVPAGIDLGARHDVAIVIPLLAHLATCWAPKPPMRGSIRRHVDSRLRVIHGLAAVLKESFAPGGNPASLELWTVEDMSLGGLGVQVEASRNEPIRIGALVGMQPEGGENWLIGIVRRYVRTGQNRGSVGIETLSKTTRAVVADVVGLENEALLLDIPVVGETVRLILPPNTLEEGMVLVFALDGKTVRLHPLRTIETGGDFVVASFLVQSFS